MRDASSLTNVAVQRAEGAARFPALMQHRMQFCIALPDLSREASQQSGRVPDRSLDNAA
jgi:hypothetical protein